MSLVSGISLEKNKKEKKLVMTQFKGRSSAFVTTVLACCTLRSLDVGIGVSWGLSHVMGVTMLSSDYNLLNVCPCTM